MKQKHWIIALLIALAICLAFLLWPDKLHDTGNSQHADVVADHDTLKAHDAVSAWIIDSLSKEVTDLKATNKKLKEGQQMVRKELNNQTEKVIRRNNEVRALNKDTGYLARKVDSLTNEVDNLTFLLTQYEKYADSINRVTDSLSATYDVKDKEREKAKAELQLAYDKLYKAYNELFDTTAGLMKDLKRQKLKTKVAAVLGAGAAVILILK